MGESSKGNGKVKVGDNVLPINLLPYLAEAYMTGYRGQILHTRPSYISRI
jgi:hypothetical protein